MKFELVDPPEDAAPDAPESEVVRPLAGRRSPSVGGAVPHVGPIQGDLGRARLDRAVEQVRAVVEDLRARAAAQSMAEVRADHADTVEPADDFRPLLFRAREERRTGRAESEKDGASESGENA
ncbi:hypothetical protein [Nocardiopsis lucentensis]|uniref:hypothetical protein n=1 Tax=Nocardiopsis lucentensis TaxID=53441 RepID=UPI0003698AE4|nr:hypothetical protein [Nocardiopsis lucentensis]